MKIMDWCDTPDNIFRQLSEIKILLTDPLTQDTREWKFIPD